jgi:glycosyltransferase involved in cell wall biosynthesis
MPEVAGDGACLVDPFCVESIRAGFLRVMNNVPYRELLLDQGRKNRVRFDEQQLAEKYLDLYRHLYR